jgi:hypothetical protein
VGLEAKYNWIQTSVLNTGFSFSDLQPDNSSFPFSLAMEHLPCRGAFLVPASITRTNAAALTMDAETLSVAGAAPALEFA